MTPEFWTAANSLLEPLVFWITAYATLISALGAIASTGKLRHFWRTRYLRRVWGIRNGDQVIVVCSELEEPERRQYEEEREFIYSLKYGDLDAYVEVLTNLLRLYPAIRIRVMSAGEAETTQLDLARHLVVIGGPDYNTLAERVLSWNQTQFEYRSAELDVPPVTCPQEIVLYDKVRDEEHCHEATDTRDKGYFERIPNRHNPKSRVILIGGCHTIGVTGAAKAFSMGISDDGRIPNAALDNAKLVAKAIGKSEQFSILFDVERHGQTISIPLAREESITVASR